MSSLPAFWGTWTSHCNALSMHAPWLWSFGVSITGTTTRPSARVVKIKVTRLSKLLLYIHAGLAILVTSETEVVAFLLFIQSTARKKCQMIESH